MKKLIALLIALSLLTLSLASCSFIRKEKEDDTVIRIAYMNGPTGMGMAKLIHDNGGVEGNEKYQFVKYNDAALATADLKEGKVDMACIPTNTAATLYNKTESINVLALNCLNSLYIMTKTGVEIDDFSELEGKTIYTIKNGTPAAILEFLLSESDVNATVRTSIGEGENEKDIVAPTDLAPLLIAGKIDIALVPEPVATAAPLKIASQNKDYTYRVAIDLADAWAEISDSPVAMGCIIANKDFVANHKSLVDTFLDEYKQSIEYISNLENLENAATYVVDAGVLDAVPAAKKSLTNLGSSIAYSDGIEMRSTLIAFYNAIGLNLIGGKLPDDDFYYEK
jgi:NitT/TauT family transport system substrate-binding protein